MLNKKLTDVNKNYKRANYSSEEIKKFYKEAENNLVFFNKISLELLTWDKKFDKVLDESEAPFYKWFSGGLLNP
ncbi:MAG TPA: AMP-dependent synthetase, partial [Flexistipes sinusarabici]|nr:AMP-dependent synthetase [Flexistipes sinusarabici]